MCHRVCKILAVITNVTVAIEALIPLSLSDFPCLHTLDGSTRIPCSGHLVNSWIVSEKIYTCNSPFSSDSEMKASYHRLVGKISLLELIWSVKSCHCQYLVPGSHSSWSAYLICDPKRVKNIWVWGRFELWTLWTLTVSFSDIDFSSSIPRA